MTNVFAKHARVWKVVYFLTKLVKWDWFLKMCRNFEKQEPFYKMWKNFNLWTKIKAWTFFDFLTITDKFEKQWTIFDFLNIFFKIGTFYEFVNKSWTIDTFSRNSEIYSNLWTNFQNGKVLNLCTNLENKFWSMNIFWILRTNFEMENNFEKSRTNLEAWICFQ